MVSNPLARNANYGSYGGLAQLVEHKQANKRNLLVMVMNSKLLASRGLVS